MVGGSAFSARRQNGEPRWATEFGGSPAAGEPPTPWPTVVLHSASVLKYSEIMRHRQLMIPRGFARPVVHPIPPQLGASGIDKLIIVVEYRLKKAGDVFGHPAIIQNTPNRSDTFAWQDFPCPTCPLSHPRPAVLRRDWRRPRADTGSAGARARSPGHRIAGHPASRRPRTASTRRHHASHAGTARPHAALHRHRRQHPACATTRTRRRRTWPFIAYQLDGADKRPARSPSSSTAVPAWPPAGFRWARSGRGAWCSHGAAGVPPRLARADPQRGDLARLHRPGVHRSARHRLFAHSRRRRRARSVSGRSAATSDALADVIRRWLDRNDRIVSPKFLLGESYGGFRAPRLARELQSEQGVGVTGMVLLSPLLDLAYQSGVHRPVRLGGPPAVGGRRRPRAARAGDARRRRRRRAIRRHRLPDRHAARRARHGGARPAGDAGGGADRPRSGAGAPLPRPARHRRVPARTGARAGPGRQHVRRHHRQRRSVPASKPLSRYPDPVLEGFKAPVTSAMVAIYTRQAELAAGADLPPVERYRRSAQWDWGHGMGRPESLSALQAALSLDPRMHVLIAHGLFDLRHALFRQRADPARPAGWRGRPGAAGGLSRRPHVLFAGRVARRPASRRAGVVRKLIRPPARAATRGSCHPHALSPAGAATGRRCHPRRACRRRGASRGVAPSPVTCGAVRAMTRRMLEELEDSAASRTGSVDAELIAVIVAVTDGEPRVLTIDDGRALPSGPFETGHRSLQAALRSWVEQQTHHPLGYVEQLYTFADRDRAAPGRQVVSVSYLGLTREAPAERRPRRRGVGWQRLVSAISRGRIGVKPTRRWPSR